MYKEYWSVVAARFTNIAEELGEIWRRTQLASRTSSRLLRDPSRCFFVQLSSRILFSREDLPSDISITHWWNHRCTRMDTDGKDQGDFGTVSSCGEHGLSGLTRAGDGARHRVEPLVAPSFGVGETVRAGPSVARRRGRCWIRIRDGPRQRRHRPAWACRLLRQGLDAVWSTQTRRLLGEGSRTAGEFP